MVRLIKNHVEFKVVCSADLRDNNIDGDSTPLTANGINALCLTVASVLGIKQSRRFAISFNEGFFLCKERAKALHHLPIEDENVGGCHVRRDGSEFLFTSTAGCVIVLCFANCVKSQFFVDPHSEDCHWLTSPTKQGPNIVNIEDESNGTDPDDPAAEESAAVGAAEAPIDIEDESSDGAEGSADGATFDEESTSVGDAKNEGKIGVAEAPKRDKSRRKSRREPVMKLKQSKHRLQVTKTNEKESPNDNHQQAEAEIVGDEIRFVKPAGTESQCH